MSLSTCDKCGGHIPLGPRASNRCESCGAGVFEQQPVEGVVVSAAALQQAREALALAKWKCQNGQSDAAIFYIEEALRALGGTT